MAQWRPYGDIDQGQHRLGQWLGGVLSASPKTDVTKSAQSINVKKMSLKNTLVIHFHILRQPNSLNEIREKACQNSTVSFKNMSFKIFSTISLPFSLRWVYEHLTRVSVNASKKLSMNWWYNNKSQRNRTVRIFMAYMMTSSYGNIFRVTGPLCGEFTGDRWIPRTKARDAELWCFLWSTPE